MVGEVTNSCKMQSMVILAARGGCDASIREGWHLKSGDVVDEGVDGLPEMDTVTDSTQWSTDVYRIYFSSGKVREFWKNGSHGVIGQIVRIINTTG